MLLNVERSIPHNLQYLDAFTEADLIFKINYNF